MTKEGFLSETDTCREELAPFCSGLGMDVGFGHSKIVPSAWGHDFPTAYTRVGEDRQQLRGDCRSFPFLCDGALDYLFSSHVAEDFYYHELRDEIIPEWRRVLTDNGLLILNCPDQKRFKAHIKISGQSDNLAHKEPDFSLDTFRYQVLNQTGRWVTVFEKPEHGPYSWLLAVMKIV